MIDRYPLPWRVSEDGPPSIVDANGQYVCEGAGGDGLAFIVNAVNSHDALVGLLKYPRIADEIVEAVIKAEGSA